MVVHIILKASIGHIRMTERLYGVYRSTLPGYIAIPFAKLVVHGKNISVKTDSGMIVEIFNAGIRHLTHDLIKLVLSICRWISSWVACTPSSVLL